MTTDINENIHCELLAAYGTLRDDDDSDLPWTRDFIKNIESVATGKVLGFQLFFNPSFKYGLGIFTGDPNDAIVVRLLSWPSKEQFHQKIRLADEIEGNDYERKLVEVLVEGGSKSAYIYAAKPALLNESWEKIPSGDWLQRNIKYETIPL
ncbi:unnamed protein product [Rotaria magnacalcarata]|uniref:Gamma-glutamylcyclotransferase AIG2-like domain-containing protein n=1 Tax=Rotaria magnacalcarata TaxID=392030 RepID=A0A814Q8F6_9BILA|nr:unnamed protein product [Rotaria magnacalcarata]CAF1656506.1 unnamed protein product [Rotaria magnacalcarata]CAF2136809.1 unnamed protein product [Rotaria magnacalcarata]CAF2260757.1 unnamed protein product [Rotaria magnacalcarata]CAF4087641.1 unnamed protein product [Rotaria magnacalcarata]